MNLQSKTVYQTLMKLYNFELDTNLKGFFFFSRKYCIPKHCYQLLRFGKKTEKKSFIPMHSPVFEKEIIKTLVIQKNSLVLALALISYLNVEFMTLLMIIGCLYNDTNTVIRGKQIRQMGLMALIWSQLIMTCSFSKYIQKYQSNSCHGRGPGCESLLQLTMPC